MVRVFFDRFFSLIIVICCLPLLFFPKINLLLLSQSETAGLRIDDFILLLFSLIIFWAHFVLKIKATALERWFFAFIAFALFSYFSNRLLVGLEILHVNASIFYVFRLLEYFLFFYIGMLCSLHFPISSVIKAFLIWNILIMAGQKMGVIGHFSTTGYIPSATQYVSGIASFSSEAGALINMAFCFLVFSEDNNVARASTPCLSSQTSSQGGTPWLPYKKFSTAPYLIFLLCLIAVIFTGSRLSIFTLVLSFLFRIKQDFKYSFAPFLFIAIFIPVSALLAFELIVNTAIVFQRSEGLLSFKNIGLISLVWENIDLTLDPIEHEAVPYDNYDMSWWLRIRKWCYALKIYYLNPECYLQGIGPGFAKAALDGGYLRLLTENGIIGSLLFGKSIYVIYRQTPYLKWMTIAFLINMIFFDIYLAYKPMSLLFLVSGWAYSQECREAKN